MKLSSTRPEIGMVCYSSVPYRSKTGIWKVKSRKVAPCVLVGFCMRGVAIFTFFLLCLSVRLHSMEVRVCCLASVLALSWSLYTRWSSELVLIRNNSVLIRYFPIKIAPCSRSRQSIEVRNEMCCCTSGEVSCWLSALVPTWQLRQLSLCHCLGDWFDTY